jgi:hypothetical protein
MSNESKPIDATDILKQEHRRIVEERLKRINFDNIDKEDTVTLYHATSSYYLNSILQSGILCRAETNNSNWAEQPSVDKMT